LVRRLQVASVAAIDRDESTGKPFHKRQMEQDEAIDGLGQGGARRRDPLHSRRLGWCKEASSRLKELGLVLFRLFKRAKGLLSLRLYRRAQVLLAPLPDL